MTRVILKEIITLALLLIAGVLAVPIILHYMAQWYAYWLP